MNHKKSMVRVVILAVFACILAAVCFWTDFSDPSLNTIELPAANEIDAVDIITLDGARVSYSDEE